MREICFLVGMRVTVTKLVKAPVRGTWDLWFESLLWHTFFSQNYPLLYRYFTWLTPPGPYRVTICRERKLILDPHKDKEDLLGWVISSMPGPPPRQHKHERRYTSWTHPFILTRRIWKDDYDGQMIFGDLVDLKFPDIYLTDEENPRKNLTQKTCPIRGPNPGPLRDRCACYRLFHSGGQSRN